MLLLLAAILVSCNDNKQRGDTTETNEFMRSSDKPANEVSTKPFHRDDIFAPDELKGDKDEPEFKIEKVE